MKKLIGIFLFLLILYGLLLYSDEGARSLGNHLNLAERIGHFGLIGIGAGLLIITGGIDLSIGSVALLSATTMAILLGDHNISLWLVIPLVLALGCAIGLLHGLLVTKLRVQAFVVTLCGLFMYRGIARWLAGDVPRAIPDWLMDWKYDVFIDQMPQFSQLSYLILLGIIGVIGVVFLHFSIYGRYLTAIGNNERAALYSGVKTDRYKILAYVICSGLASCFGMLFMMRFDQVQPSGDMAFFELYAIAAAVLGGCSLRGGEGAVIGMIIGTAILRLLDNIVNMYGIPNELKATVVGLALLLGVVLDETLRRRRTA